LGSPPPCRDVNCGSAAWLGWMTGPVPGLLVVFEPDGVYRPRHPETTVFYQVMEQHFDRYVYAYEERFEPRSGPLRSSVRPAVEAFLGCGRLDGGTGFARIRCDSCKAEHLLALSCRSYYTSSDLGERFAFFSSRRSPGSS
jgi:hypothetical protein